jgi:hypothetical protein
MHGRGLKTGFFSRCGNICFYFKNSNACNFATFKNGMFLHKISTIDIDFSDRRVLKSRHYLSSRQYRGFITFHTLL